MKKYIFNQWKNKKGTILLIMIGFFIGNLVLSIGTSISVETIKQSYDSNSGIAQKQLEIDLYGIEGKEIEQNVVKEICEKLANYGEIQIISIEKVKTNYSDSYQVVPVKFYKSEDWHIPIIEGKYFSIEQISDEDKQVIVGKEIAKKNTLHIGESMEINGENYTITGICGRENRGTQWDSVLYVPYDDFIASNEEYLKKNYVGMILKSGKEVFLEEFAELEEKAFENNVELVYQEFDTESVKSATNSIIITIIATVLVFVIAIINITNLLVYWMMERNKDLAILKAMGANNSYLTRWLLVEIFIITIVSALLAIVVQMVGSNICSEWLVKNEIYCIVTYWNFIISFLVTTICGIISIILPTKQVLQIQPSESMKN